MYTFKIFRFMRAALIDIAGLSGCAAVVYGIMLVSMPLAWIAGGLMVTIIAWMLAE